MSYKNRIVWMYDFVYCIQIIHIIAISTNISSRSVSFATNTTGQLFVKQWVLTWHWQQITLKHVSLSFSLLINYHFLEWIWYNEYWPLAIEILMSRSLFLGDISISSTVLFGYKGNLRSSKQTMQSCRDHMGNMVLKIHLT